MFLLFTQLYDSEEIPNHNEMEDLTKHQTQKLVITKLNPVITKLNPEVKEFIPSNLKKSKKKSPKEDLNNQSFNDTETKDISELNQVVCKDNIDNEAQSPKISNDVEIPERLEVLKTKKLRKNVAMSSINTINANAEATSFTKKLFTPDDFCLKQRTIDDDMADNLASFRNEKQVLDNLRKHSKITESTNKLNEIEEGNPEAEVNPQEVQESIKKVTNWLEVEPKKPVPPKPISPPYLGPITYRKKQIGSQKSESQSTTATTPESNSKSTSSISPVPSKPPAYKPSSYAEELLKKFERNAAKTAAASEDMWTKLERELKAKDEVLAKKGLDEGNSPLEVQMKKGRGRKR